MIFAREAVLVVGIGLNLYGFSVKKNSKTGLPESIFIMLDVIHKNF